MSTSGDSFLACAFASGLAFDSVFGFESEALVDTAFLNFLIRDGEGALKGAMGRTVLFINQADEVALPLEGILAPVPLILGSLREDRIYGSL